MTFLRCFQARRRQVLFAHGTQRGDYEKRASTNRTTGTDTPKCELAPERASLNNPLSGALIVTAVEFASPHVRFGSLFWRFAPLIRDRARQKQAKVMNCNALPQTEKRCRHGSSSETAELEVWGPANAHANKTTQPETWQLNLEVRVRLKVSFGDVFHGVLSLAGVTV